MLIHTVAPGETLTSIAADYNLTASYLERINELPNPESLVVGQDIVVAGLDFGPQLIQHQVGFVG